ncbi:hypothetical protein [Streptomyces odontomachi]|uniref:hypothetical protein n=1 Tax=Streptomyces odontomachi TaxID=2944940 RepID=UPI002109FE20|nr:hypothetical protein [Streptomyces sp. ODS25]
MADSLTLAGLSATVLTEGIRFLYGQAGEVIRQHREGRAERRERSVVPEVVAEPRELPPPDPELVEGFRADLEFCRTYLEPFVTGERRDALLQGAVDPQVIEVADALRRVLGAVHQVPIVFADELSGAGTKVVRGSVEADVVAGILIGVRAKVVSATIDAHARAGRIEAGGEVIAADIVGGE